jgi:hypothetical protein
MRRRLFFVLIATVFIAAASFEQGIAGKGEPGSNSAAGAESGRSYRVGSLAKDEPQEVYSPNPRDPWNRIFYCLFTRSVQLRVSDEFADAAPFMPVYINAFDKISVSTRSCERIEPGDRAIEPLYPYDFCILPQGAATALTEPRFSQLQRALTDALEEGPKRPLLARALMQTDMWAAYDMLHKHGRRITADTSRVEQLVPLLAKFVKKLALTRAEIDVLPHNYVPAARAGKLPDLFEPGSAWMQIWERGRVHDYVADYRRATRVFLKPSSPPSDKQAFIDSFRERIDIAQLEAVALVMQLLLIDTNGQIVPTDLTYFVQLRTFVRESGKFKETRLAVNELSRKLLLADPKSCGFATLKEKDPAYLPFAGNDYGFASRMPLGRGSYTKRDLLSRESILVTQRRHCASCHSENLTGLRTFSKQPMHPSPPVKLLDPSANDHGHFVAQEKLKREDFKTLMQEWGR